MTEETQEMEGTCDRPDCGQLVIEHRMLREQLRIAADRTGVKALRHYCRALEMDEADVDWTRVVPTGPRPND